MWLIIIAVVNAESLITGFSSIQTVSFCVECSFWNLYWTTFSGLLGYLALLGLDGTSWLFGTSWPGWNFLVWPGLLGFFNLLGLAGTSWPGWDFLTWLVLLGLAWTSWLGWDFLIFLDFLVLLDFLTSLGHLGNWWNTLKLCCLYTPRMLIFQFWNFKFPWE